jgi:2-alkenal reductase
VPMVDVFRLALLVFALGAAGWVSFGYVQLSVDSPTGEGTVTARCNLMDSEETAVRIFSETHRSVASVLAVQHMNRPSPHSVIVIGSGFVWDNAGHIVTNYHVVSGADEIAVRLDSGSPHRAVVVGSAPNDDLAVLHMNAGHRLYAPLSIGSSANLQVGQAVYAIGSPFSLSATLSHGLVSALHQRLPTRSGREMRGIIQTDAPINPGNSGGPLLDSAGRLIGVNTAIASRSGAFDGVSFAVPVDLVDRVVTTLIRQGRLPVPKLGIASRSQSPP